MVQFTDTASGLAPAVDEGLIACGGKPAANGGAAALRSLLREKKRLCAANLQRGGGSVVPLLWQGGLAGSGAAAFGTQTERREAFEDDSTEAEPVGFFCSS